MESHLSWNLQVEHSPTAALNRTYALAKANGKISALSEAEKLELHDNQFYFALLGDLYTDIDNKKAILNLTKAIALAKSPAVRNALQKKVDKINIDSPVY